VWTEPSRAQELGRLFFAPQERAALDAQRKAKRPEPAAAAKGTPQHIQVDGYVLRSEGESTLWLNGESQVRDPRLAKDAEGIGRVALPGTRKGLRVGESYDGASGKVSDLLGGGELRVVPVERSAR